MKRRGMLFAISLFTLVFAASLPVYAAVPSLVEKIVENREFFAAFTGYEDHYLFDAKRFDENRIGLVLLDPMGCEIRMVSAVKSGEAIYVEMIIPEKGKRAEMKSGSIKVVDAIRLAKSALAYEKRR
jgi:hypothetical protein